MHSDLSVETIILGFRARWKLLLAILVTFWVAGALYVTFAERQYQADVEFYYSDQSMPGPVGGLAALANTVGLSSARSSGREVALATLKSRQVATDFVRQHDLLPVLYPELWDSQSKTWKVPKEEIPTPRDGAARLISSRVISDDSATGVVRLAFRLPRQDVVAPMANDFVRMTDDILRRRALDQSQQSLAYLEEQLRQASMTELRGTIAALVQQQMERIAVTHTQRNYAFEIIDTAIAPKQPAWPRRGLLLAALTLVALIGGALLSVVIDLRKAGYLP